MAPSTQRRLAAIMFTDIVGYTTLMAESEERGLWVRERHRSVLRPLAEQHNGQIVDENGDELVLSFPSALDAVSCALAVQTELRDDSELQLRVGVHLGDVVFEGARIYGDGVNVASRIRPLAGPGGICVSDEVYRSIRNQTDIEAIALGRQELKNVGQPIEVYAVGRPGEVTAPVLDAPATLLKRVLAVVAIAALLALGVWGWNRTVLAPRSSGPIRSIAVLPLENLSGDPEQEYVADGMTEALIGELAKLGSLSVISRTSVMGYKHSDKSLPEIASELGVEGVLEGAVIREGDQVRVTAQLIDARTDTHIWNDRFDRELSGVLALQSDVARAVAEQIRLELTPREEALLTVSRTVDPRAYDAYLRGRHLMGPDSLVIAWGPPAIDQLERAVELDPDFAEGWALLARVRATLAFNGFDLRYRSEFPKARADAERALELDDRLVRAHLALNVVRRYHDWDFVGARRALERAAELSPNDPSVLNGAFFELLRQGKVEDALRVSERLPLVAPFDLFWRAERAGHLVFARQYEAAVEEFERVRELFPDFADTAEPANYVMLGRYDEAHRAYMAYFEQCGEPCDRLREAFERGWAEGGWEGALRAWVEWGTKREGYNPFVIAALYSWLGETDEAFAWLERGYRERDPQMRLLFHPALDPLRADPRFDDLLRRIGFPES